MMDEQERNCEQVQKINAAKNAHAVLIKTKELIFYGIQLTDAVHRNEIQPKCFLKKNIVFESYSSNQFHFELDWEKYPKNFKETADDIQVLSAGHAIIICKESYSNLLWVLEEEDSDLYAAQMILKLIRDAIGHMKACSDQQAIPCWKIMNSNNRRIFEIKKLGIILDARNLDGKQFKFSQLGGFANLLKIFDFLIENLQTKYLNHK